MVVIPLDAVVFEDFIDGYFPLQSSLEALLDRRGFAAAWFLMLVTPMMEMPGLDGSDPVPLHLDPALGGQIDWLAASIRRTHGKVTVSGHAQWRWNNPGMSRADGLQASLRLAEPAFLRGIGCRPGDIMTRSLGDIGVGREDSDIALGISDAAKHAGATLEPGMTSKDWCCWLLEETPGLAEPMFEEGNPWAIPFSRLQGGNSNELLLLHDNGNAAVKHIIKDSQQYD